MGSHLGIGISVHNRNKISEHCLIQWLKFIPFDCKIIIVDDGSEIPFKYADYRFEKSVGISIVKNKCFQLLEDCDHIFLVDNDIHPVRADWWSRYVNSELQHAMYIFGRNLREPRGNDWRSYDLPRGCLLYFTKECLQQAGGFDVKFNRYSFEHAELSRRIYNMGLTPAPYLDVFPSHDLFYSYDEHYAIQSSISAVDKMNSIRVNRRYFEATKNSNTFIAYK